MAKIPGQKLKFKLNIIVGGFITLSFLILTFRIIYIACFAKINGMKYSDKAYNQQLRSEKIRANRGTIYDRNMIPIAQNATVWTVSISPIEIKNDNEREKVVNKLHELFPDVEKEDIEKKCASKTKYEIIKLKCEKPERDAILNFEKKQKIGCIHLTEDSKRYYAYNKMGSHVVGFCGRDLQGITGLEKYYDSELKGSDGKIISVQNGKGQPMPYNFESIVKAQDGNSLVTTIDVNVQRILEKSLQNACEYRMPLNRAAGIVMDATNYEILAMATWPGFDLNNPFELPSLKEFPELENVSKKDALNKNWTNKAISDLLEPGSTFKILTSSAALESGVMELNQTFNCSGQITVGPNTIHCWKTKGHGHQDFEMAMVNSCNPALVEMGSALGAHKFSQFFKLFGLDKPTGIDTIGEAKPLFYKENQIGPVELASMSFGQSNSLNPLQMAKLFSEVITGYDYGKPHLVNRIIDQNGNTIKAHKPGKKTQILSESTVSKMRKILVHVVDGADRQGTNAHIIGYEIAGKSGTAQNLHEKSKLKEGEKERHTPSYIAAFNLKKHPIVVQVLIDKPTRNDEYFAGVVNAPVIRDIIEKLVSYYGIPPDYINEEIEKLFKQTPKCEGTPLDTARNLLLENDFSNFEFVGDGDHVNHQIPPCGTKVNKNTKVMLYTEEISERDQVTVPNIVGLTQKQANNLLANHKLNLNIANNHKKIGIAINQSPEPGTKVVKGEIVSGVFVAHDSTD